MFIRKWNKVFTRRNGKSKVTMPSRRKTAPTGVAIVGSSLGLSRTFTPALFPCQLRQPWLPQCYRGKRERIIVAELITWQAAPTPAPPQHTYPTDTPGSQLHSNSNEATRKEEKGGYRFPPCHTWPSSSDSSPNTSGRKHHSGLVHRTPPNQALHRGKKFKAQAVLRLLNTNQS